MKKAKQCIILGKNSLFIISIICMLTITGCGSSGSSGSRVDNLEKQSLDIEDHADEIMNQVLEALNSHDEEQLANVFSEGVRNDVSNISEMSEKAVEFYQGTGEIIETSHLLMEKKSRRGTISIAQTSKYIVETGDETYFILIVMYDRNDFDESMEGLYLVQITTEELYEEDGFKCKNLDYEPGIYIQNDKADEYVATYDLIEKEAK